jgi:hypothetical protein
MEVLIQLIVIMAVFYNLNKWLSIRRTRVKAYIDPGMLAGKPVLYCMIGNYYGRKPITVRDCHLVVDDQPSQMPVSEPSISLPRIVQTNEGIVVHFDPIPVLSEARERGQANFKVRALFHDYDDRAYLSKPLTIQTDQRRFIRIFEDEAEHLSPPAKIVTNMAQEIAEQLNQQFVGIPHIILALICEQNGVGGYVLRELGLSEDFLLNLARNSHNLPRDHAWPQPHWSTEVHQLIYKFVIDEARKMRQRCHGTGHLLLGLTQQKHESFLTILKHLGIQPRQLHARVYEVLQKDLNPTDHPTLPPEGIKRHIWTIWYQFTHTLLIIYLRVLMLFYPNIEL